MALSTPAVPPKPVQADYVPLKQVRSVAQALRHPETLDRFRSAAPGWSNGERLQRLCYAAVMNNELLQKAPMWTLVRSCLQLGSLGLEPNSPLGHGYLIPFGRGEKAQVQTIVGYKGYILLAHNSGINNVRGDVVYEGDPFEYEYGTSQFLRHRVGGSRYGRTPIWAYGTFGQEFEVRAYADVLAIRDASQGYRYALTMRDDPKRRYIYESTPWVAHEHPMAAKTMIRSSLRFAPLSPELAVASQMDSRSEAGERTDFRHMNTGMDTGFVEGLPEDVEDLTGAVQGGGPGAGTTSTLQEGQAGAGQTRQGPGTDASDDRGIGGTGTPRNTADDAQAGSDKPAGEFMAYLLDAAGDAEEVDGQFSVWTDPVQWTVAFMDRFGKAPEDVRPALLEHNADAILEARANVSAALVLEAACAEPGSGPDASRWEVRLVTNAQGKPDHTATVHQITRMLNSCESVADVASAHSANVAMINALPQSAQRIVQRAFDNRRKALAPPVQNNDSESTSAGAGADDSDQTDRAASGSDGENTDKDAERVQVMINALNAATDSYSLEQIARSATHTTPLARFARERPELAEKYSEALARNREALKNGRADG